MARHGTRLHLVATALLAAGVAACGSSTPAGAPGSDGGLPDPDGGAPAPDGGGPLPVPDHFLDVRTGGFDVPSSGTDLFQCFFTRADLVDPAGVASFEVLDQSPVAHHLVIFHDRSPGGEPVSRACDAMELDWEPLFAAGNNTDQLTMPGGVAFPLDPSAQLVLQLHYFNETGGTITDDSGVRMGLLPEGAAFQRAAMLVFGNINFSVPPRSTGTTASATCTPRSSDWNLFAVFPHMHRLGAEISVVLEEGGTVTPLVDRLAWDFSNQPMIPVSQLAPDGSTLRVTCTWDNPTNRTVGFGESSNDEMCFALTYYYPDDGTFLCLF